MMKCAAPGTACLQPRSQLRWQRFYQGSIASLCPESRPTRQCGKLNASSTNRGCISKADCQLREPRGVAASSCYAFAAGPETEDLVLRWIWPCRDRRYEVLVSPPQAGAECRPRGRAKGNITICRHYARFNATFS